MARGYGSYGDRRHLSLCLGVPTKTYGQMCPLARSLDVLGERWTMLVIRELLLGPKRFKHLLAVLPAIGSNRLSERLRGLEQAGIIRKRTLPPPAAVAVYELTEEESDCAIH